MLNIILLILKIAGIVLLCILGLLLLITLALLFIPVRYEGNGRAGVGIKPAGAVRAGWLLGLVRIEAGYRDSGSYFRFRILGWEPGRKKAPANKGKKKSSETAGPAETSASAPVKTAALPAPAQEKKEEVPALPDTADAEKTTEPEKTAAVQKPVRSEASAKPESSAKTESSAKNRISKLREKFARKQKRKKTPAGPSAAEKINRFIASIPEKVCSLIDRLAEAAEHAQETIENILERIEKCKAKAEPLIDSRSRAFYARVWTRVKKTLHHWRIRRIKGYLDFGTGSPDQTGLLTGIVYMLLPASADRFVVRAEMFDKELDTDFEFKGHIRMCHAIAAALPILLDKDFRRTIRLVKKVRGGK